MIADINEEAPTVVEKIKAGRRAGKGVATPTKRLKRMEDDVIRLMDEQASLVPRAAGDIPALPPLPEGFNLRGLHVD